MALVLCDQDGVLGDFETHLYRGMAELHPEAVLLPPADLTEFYIDLDPAHAEWAEHIEALPRREGFFAGIPPLPGALEGLEALREAGHDVWICTAPLSSPYCMAEKLEWVERHLGAWWERRVILSRDKTLVRGDVLIDDKPAVTGSLTPTWRHVLFGTYGHHRSSTVELRAPTWADVPAAVEAAVTARASQAPYALP